MSETNSPTEAYKALIKEYGISEPIDIGSIGDIPLRILILSSYKSKLEPVASFLSRRGWETTICTDLTEAIRFAVKEKPKFILLSANHSNPKITMIPLVLQHSLRARCVAFAESENEGARELVESLNVPYRFYGQMTGPSLHRQIIKIILDEIELAKTSQFTLPTAPKVPMTADEILSRLEITENDVERTIVKSAEQINNDVYKISAPNLEELTAKQAQEIVRALKRSLGTVCKEQLGAQTQELHLVDSVGVLPYRFEKAAGYMAVAWADEKNLDRPLFLRALRKAFVDSFLSEGFDADFDDDFVMEHANLDFKKWARKSSSFSMSKSHLGSEISVASFPSKIGTVYRPPANEKMIPIDAFSISPDHEVNFELYLQLVVNKRYATYVHAGGKLLDVQLRRLKDNNIRFLHIREEDFVKYSRHLRTREIQKSIADIEVV